MRAVLSFLIFNLFLLLLAEWQIARQRSLASPSHQTGRWFYLAVVSKSLASCAFILFFYLYSATLDAFGYGILAALICSLLGDILLLPKQNHLAFKFGIGAFALAHIAYSVAFFPLVTVSISLILLAAINLLFAALIFRWLGQHLSGGFRWLVPGYLLIIGVMVTLGGTISLAGYSVWLGIGSLLFAISDVFVARNRFVSPGLINRLVGLPLYYCGQIMIAYGAIIHLQTE